MGYAFIILSLLYTGIALGMLKKAKNAPNETEEQQKAQKKLKMKSYAYFMFALTFGLFAFILFKKSQ